MSDFNFEELLENYLPENINRGEEVEGILVRKEKEYAYLDINSKLEGRVRTAEVEDFNEGDTVKVLVGKEEESFINVSRRAIELEENWTKLLEIYKEEKMVEGTVVRKVNGGYIVDILKWNTFMPNSLSGFRNNDDVINKKITVIIKDVKEEKRKRVLVSRKDVRLKEENEYLNNVNIGDEVEVEIQDVMDFGLSVSVGKIIGFIHISEVAWEKVEKLKELFEIGQKIQAKIIEKDEKNRSIKLSIKQLTEDPWNSAGEKYELDTETEGKVVRIAKFGAFVELEKGIEGLVHISDLTWSKKLKNVEEFIQVGDTVKVKVIELNLAEKRLKLSIKALQQNPWETAMEKLSVGDVVKGKVIEIKAFGMFVEVSDAVDAFIHISDYSWEKANAADYKTGDEIELKIIEIDQQAKKIKGGIKQLTKSPWEIIKEDYKVGDVIKREINNITDFGLFVKIEKNIDGMIHISEASKDFIKNLSERFKLGDEVEAEIIEIDDEKKKVKLSIKKLELEKQNEEEKELIEKYSVTD